jgi:hypothetical protein
MLLTSKIFVLLSALAFTAILASHDFDKEVAQAPRDLATSTPTSTMYSISVDSRKCASPVCGGYFIKAVNRGQTRCSDGKIQDSCYVGGLDFSRFGFGGDQTFNDAVNKVGLDGILVKGYYKKNAYPNNKNIAQLALTAIYESIVQSYPCNCGVDEECLFDPSSSCDGCSCPKICHKTRIMCGGIAGLTCPKGLKCADDPSNSCNPKTGGADCSGMCVGRCSSSDKLCTTEIGGFCGGLLGQYCGAGLECVEAYSDGCNTRCGAFDCGGVCLPIGG